MSQCELDIGWLLSGREMRSAVPLMWSVEGDYRLRSLGEQHEKDSPAGQMGYDDGFGRAMGEVRFLTKWIGCGVGDLRRFPRLDGGVIGF